MHAEILSKEQNTILPILGRFASEHGFYLGGGTAVSLYFGHRRSIDFDWFTSQELADPLFLAENARRYGMNVDRVQTAPRTLHLLLESVRVSFFEYPYPEINSLILWPEYSISLASLDDLACMKLAAIAQRGSRKDFIDLYFIALQHIPIGKALELYRQKYSLDDITPVIIGLTYFDDADEEPSPTMLHDISWDNIKKQFERWATEIAG